MKGIGETETAMRKSAVNSVSDTAAGYSKETPPTFFFNEDNKAHVLCFEQE